MVNLCSLQGETYDRLTCWLGLLGVNLAVSRADLLVA